MNNDLRDLYSCKDYENMMFKVESNYVLCGSKIIPTETTYHFVDLDKNQKAETKYSFIKNLNVRFSKFVEKIKEIKEKAYKRSHCGSINDFIAADCRPYMSDGMDRNGNYNTAWMYSDERDTRFR